MHYPMDSAWYSSPIQQLGLQVQAIEPTFLCCYKKTYWLRMAQPPSAHIATVSSLHKTVTQTAEHSTKLTSPYITRYGYLVPVYIVVVIVSR